MVLNFVTSLKSLILIMFLSVLGLGLLLYIQQQRSSQRTLNGAFVSSFFFTLFLAWAAKNSKVLTYFWHYMRQKKVAMLPLDQHKPKRNQVDPQV